MKKLNFKFDEDAKNMRGFFIEELQPLKYINKDVRFWFKENTKWYFSVKFEDQWQDWFLNEDDKNKIIQDTIKKYDVRSSYDEEYLLIKWDPRRRKY